MRYTPNTLLIRALVIVIPSLLAVPLLLNAAKDAAREVNLRAINPFDEQWYSQSTFYRPSTDAYYDGLLEQLVMRDYTFSGRDNSEVVANLKKRGIEVVDILDSSNFSSLYSLLYRLRIENRIDDEFGSLKAWIEGKLYPSSFTLYDLDRLLNYLENVYVIPGRQCLRSNQFARAKRMFKEASKRIRLIDLPPLNIVDPYSMMRINRILLMEAFTWNVPSLYRAPAKARAVMDGLFRGIDPEDIPNIEGIVWTPDLEPARLYLCGLIYFHRKDWGDAWDAFSKSEKLQSTSPLKDLTILMKVRCVFWAHEKDTLNSLHRIMLNAGLSQSNVSILKLIQSCESQERTPTYVRDISIYAEKLRDQMKGGL